MIPQNFGKLNSSICMGSISGADTFGSNDGFTVTQVVVSGFGEFANNGLRLHDDGRYLILVRASITNANGANNQNTGFSILNSSDTDILETCYASRPGTDVSILVPVFGFAYIDITSAKTIRVIPFSGTASDSLTVVNGQIMAMKINIRQ